MKKTRTVTTMGNTKIQNCYLKLWQFGIQKKIKCAPEYLSYTAPHAASIVIWLKQ